MAEVIDFQHESATCQLVLWDNGTVSLSNVYSTVRNKGHATKLLNDVIRWADERGILLKTAAEAHGQEPKLSNPQLVEFYKKFGFFALENAKHFIYMERKPN